MPPIQASYPSRTTVAPSAIMLVTAEQLVLRANACLTERKPGPPAIVISPSQLATYDRCNRRWAWETIAGFRSPPTKSQLLGIRVHKVFENWLRFGTPPDRRTLEGRVALKGLHHLPPPGVGVVEKQFYLTTRQGLYYTGIADWIGWHDVIGAVVIDHKSTASLRWAKTAEELEFDVQALLYAIFACISMQTDRVTLRWNYVQSDAKNARIVEATLHLGQIIERFPIVQNKAAEMVSLRQQKMHPLRVLPNPNACGDFGGCPHQARCQLTAVEKMEAIMTNEANGTMRETMNALTAYNQQPQQPQLPPGGYIPGAPSGVQAYLPTGPTQLHGPAPVFQPSPGYVDHIVAGQGGVPMQQPVQQPMQAQPPQQPQTQCEPFYQDAASGYLVDARTNQLLPPTHPAYVYPQSYQQYRVSGPMIAPTAPAAVPPPQGMQPGASVQPGYGVTSGAGGPVTGFPQQPQQQPQQYPNYTPHSGPNAPEQHASQNAIPAPIATPALHVEGIPGAPKKRGRKSKAEKDAEIAAAGGPTAHAMQVAATQTIEERLSTEEIAFMGAVNGFISSGVNMAGVTPDQLVYVGNMAREAFRKAFGGDGIFSEGW